MIRKDNEINLFMSLILPKYLSNGDLIHIVAPARFVDREFIEFAIAKLSEFGLRVEPGKNLYKQDNQFAGSDIEKLEDINDAIRNPEVRGILCARGGYGSVRIIDKIDIAALKKDPKWIVGYSDITAILNHILAEANIAGIHGTMPVNFAKNSDESIQYLVNALTGNENTYAAPTHKLNRNGTAEGRMVGGNLSMIYSLLGSKTQPNTDGNILFLEDLDEYLYHIDRMMMALKRAGMFENLAGLIIGGMSDMNDNAVPFGKSAEETIRSQVSEYAFPVCFNFPSGHIDDNRAWIHGKKIRLTVKNDQPSIVVPIKE